MARRTITLTTSTSDDVGTERLASLPSLRLKLYTLKGTVPMYATGIAGNKIVYYLSKWTDNYAAAEQEFEQIKANLYGRSL